MTATAIERLAAQCADYREQLEERIREVRGEMGASAAAKGLVWQEMRDRWAVLVRHHRAVCGLPVAIQGGKASFLMLPADGPLLA